MSKWEQYFGPSTLERGKQKDKFFCKQSHNEVGIIDGYILILPLAYENCHLYPGYYVYNGKICFGKKWRP